MNGASPNSELTGNLNNVRANVSIIVWSGLAFFAAAWVALILAAPLAQSAGHAQFASAIYTTFSYVCHQIPERSFHLAGYKFGVCSRCTGLYAGFALAALVYPLARSLNRTDTPRLIWLILAAFSIVIDFSLTYFGIWQNTYASRFVTGALLGSVAVFYIVPGLIDLSLTLGRRRRADAGG